MAGLSPDVEVIAAQSFTLSGTVQINAGGTPGSGNQVFLGLHGTIAGGEAWRLRRTLVDVGPVGFPDWRADLFLRKPREIAETVLESLVLGATIPTATYFTPVSFTATLGPYRLGARLGVSAVTIPAGAPVDNAESGAIVYAWYEDAATVYNETVAGQNVLLPPFLIAGEPTLIVTAAGGLVVDASGGVGGGEKVMKFTVITINGTLLDVAGMALSDADWQEVAAGSFNLTGNPAAASFTAAPGATVTYDAEVRDYAGTVIATAQILDNWLTTVELHNAVQKTPFAATVPLAPTAYVVPINTSYSRPSRNQPGEVILTMSAAWMAANEWDSADLPVVLEQASVVTGALSYLPVRVTHQAAVEVDRPIGGRPSSWIINSGANGSVGETAGATVFTVTNTAARFTRTFAENWRNLIDSSKPDFGVDRYEILRRHYLSDLGEPQTVYPEDVWWWNSYQFLRLNVTATGTATLTLQVDGIDLQALDTHNPDPVARTAALGFSHRAERRIYTVTVTAGTVDYWIDLSFPTAYISESGAYFPMRRPRVDTLTLSASATGTFTVNAMELSRRDSYPNQASVAFSPVSGYNAEWCGMYLRVDGEATPTLTFPDDVNKGMESDLGVGGAPRHAAPETEEQRTVETFWSDLAKWEGFAVTYDDTARAAFHRDGFGTEFVSRFGEPAQYARETTPGTDWTGSADAHSFQPLHSLRVGSVQFPNAVNVTLRGRKRLGGGVEAVVCVGGARGPAALTFRLLDAANNVLATGITSDARGRIHYEPVKPGKIVRFEAT